MSSVWDGERGDGFAPDEEIAATIKDAMGEANERNARIQAFHNGVREMHGQLGSLLRQVAHAYAEFCSAESFGGTTVGEESRLNGVVDEAMSTLDWLREGQS